MVSSVSTCSSGSTQRTLSTPFGWKLGSDSTSFQLDQRYTESSTRTVRGPSPTLLTVSCTFSVIVLLLSLFVKLRTSLFPVRPSSEPTTIRMTSSEEVEGMWPTAASWRASPALKTRTSPNGRAIPRPCSFRFWISSTAWPTATLPVLSHSTSINPSLSSLCEKLMKWCLLMGSMTPCINVTLVVLPFFNVTGPGRRYAISAQPRV
mmetsp:Transcript_2487/g.8862  ORF Transcript_2487/g.8862 Transcript_2487/m.8862 type:complete len:206 (-) Transcript_2487:736-1353(-)